MVTSPCRPDKKLVPAYPGDPGHPLTGDNYRKWKQHHDQNSNNRNGETIFPDEVQEWQIYRTKQQLSEQPAWSGRLSFAECIERDLRDSIEKQNRPAHQQNSGDIFGQ